MIQHEEEEREVSNCLQRLPFDTFIQLGWEGEMARGGMGESASSSISMTFKLHSHQM